MQGFIQDFWVGGNVGCDHFFLLIFICAANIDFIYIISQVGGRWGRRNVWLVGDGGEKCLAGGRWGGGKEMFGWWVMGGEKCLAGGGRGEKNVYLINRTCSDFKC